jgi:hypothetical protein
MKLCQVDGSLCSFKLSRSVLQMCGRERADVVSLIYNIEFESATPEFVDGASYFFERFS